MKWAYSLIIFGAGIGTGLFFYNTFNHRATAVNFTERHAGNYTFINPLLECDTAETLLTNSVRPFKEKLESFLSNLSEKQNLISMASVYFRDLNNGPWIGINEKEEFSPASLLKVPIMIAALKKAEMEPDFLKKKITFTDSDANTTEHFKPSQPMEKDASYSIDDLISRMIAQSDNNAKNLILENINVTSLEEVFKELGVEKPIIGKTDNFITVRNYASFFRILFNSSFLNKTTSEKALALLSRVDFKDGLVAGVPDTITVSHKFGERGIGGLEQLHDCGIIYYPSHPYLLCIMTRGTDLQKMVKAIAAISEFVYQQVDLQNKK